jgi:plastocyanin
MNARRLAVLVVILLVAPIGPARAAADRTETVSMRHFAFEPARTVARTGDAIRWTYDEDPLDPQPNCESPYFQLPGAPVSCPGHSATAVARGRNGKPLFDTGLHRADGFPQTVPMRSPGVFRYYCVVHGGDEPNNPLTSLTGVVIAQPSTPGRLTDGDDAAGPFDVRTLAIARKDSGYLVVSLTTWDPWAISALDAKGRAVEVVFDVDTDGTIGDADVVARLTHYRNTLLVRITGADGGSTVRASRVGSTGVRFTMPRASSAADPETDHQAAAQATGPSDRAPAFPGWLPLPAAS